MFTWYRLFNFDEFVSLDLVSYEVTISIPDVGEKTILIVKGNLVSVLVDELMLPINLNAVNPFRFGERAIFLDQYGDVHLGIYNAD